MRALVITSNSLRHKYFANIIFNEFELVGIIAEAKKSYYDKPKLESAIVSNHFDMLSSSEHKFFSKYDKFPLVKKFHLEMQGINNSEVVSWAKECNPEIVFIFGTGILDEAWLEQFPVLINLHLGLSPFYKGSATLFWPFVNNEISCVGATIHLAVKDVDAGPILKRIKPDLEVGDDYYSINYKTIKKAINALPRIASDYMCGNLLAKNHTVLSGGRVYKKSDFNESVLKKALANIGDGLTAQQLSEISGSPKCNC